MAVVKQENRMKITKAVNNILQKHEKLARIRSKEKHLKRKITNIKINCFMK